VSERDVIRFIASNGKDALDVTSVKNLMSKDVITCRQNDRLRDVALDMGANTVRHILVIDDNQNPVGIVSSVDVVIFAGVG
jgi:CBS domain-containing protein